MNTRAIDEKERISQPEDEVRFTEESSVPLSDRHRDRFLALLDNPPPANEALRRAAEWSKKRHG